MLNAEIAALAAKFPAGFQRDWDAHIYFDLETRHEACELRKKALAEFGDQPIYISAIVDKLVGPHPKPMFEIDFGQTDFDVLVPWLMRNRGSLDILVHQVTGDDPVDHFQGALWLGQTLKLDESKLDPSPIRSK